MDLFGNRFHIFAGKSKGKGYTGDRNVTTGVSLWESKKKKEKVDENAKAGYPALGIKGGTAAAKATQEKLKKKKPNDPISKTTVKAPWTKMTVPGDVAIGVKNQGTVYTAEGDDSDYTRQRQVSYGSETKSIKDHMEKGNLTEVGLKGLMRRGEVRTAYRGEEGGQGYGHGDKSPLKPSIGGDARGLHGTTVAGKVALMKSKKRANVTGSNPTIRGDVKDKGTLKSAVDKYRPGSVDHQTEYDNGLKSTRGKKKKKGETFTSGKGRFVSGRGKITGRSTKKGNKYSGHGNSGTPQESRRREEERAGTDQPSKKEYEAAGIKTATKGSFKALRAGNKV